MPSLYNVGPQTLTGMYAGFTYHFPPLEKVRIKGRRVGRGEVHESEEIAAKLYSDLAPRGLLYIDDDTPVITEEQKEIGRERLVQFIKEQVQAINDYNLEQASAGLKTTVPWAELKALQGLLVKLEGGGPEFVTRAELKEVAEKSATSLHKIISSLKAAKETGDPAAIKAMLDSINMDQLVAVSKRETLRDQATAPEATDEEVLAARGDETISPPGAIPGTDTARQFVQPTRTKQPGRAGRGARQK